MDNFIFFFIFSLCLNSFSATNIQYYERSNSLLYESSESVGLDESLTPEFKNWMATLGYSYKSSPLTLKSEDNQTTYTSIIDWFQTINYGGAYRLNKTWLIGITGSVVHSKISGNFSTHLSDTNFRINFRHSISPSTAWGIHALITVPTGSESQYLSDSGTGLGLSLAFEQNISLFQYITKIGYLENSKAVHETDINLNQSKRLIASLSLYKPLADVWGLTLDFEKIWTLPIKTIFNPNELKIGTRYAFSKNFFCFAGVGVDSINGSEPLDTRIYAGIKYSPEDDQIIQSSPHPTNSKIEIIKNPDCYDINQVEETYSAMILFDNNKDLVNNISRPEFEKLIHYTKDHFYNISHVTIHGHASKPGTDNYNFKLSNKRALNISTALLQLGLEPNLLESKGKGKKELIKLGDTEDDHQVNRRAEIKVWTRVLKKECKSM